MKKKLVKDFKKANKYRNNNTGLIFVFKHKKIIKKDHKKNLIIGKKLIEVDNKIIIKIT